jgi:hypothetical protein
MDRRSFELNYENNILFHDSALTGDLATSRSVFAGERWGGIRKSGPLFTTLASGGIKRVTSFITSFSILS